MWLKMAVISNKIEFLVIFAFILGSECHKLNVPRIMLPYFATTPINFTLEASDSCYKWRSSRPEVASVKPIEGKDGKCSHRAKVTALSTHPTQMTTVIFAEEAASGQTIRCDVIVDTIDLIDIVTTTRVLYLGDSPEEFEVRALDDEGNTFSSLEGLEFEWSLLSDNDADIVVDAKTILRLVTYHESPYDPPKYIERMEEQGKQGDRILIEGIRAGSAKVMAKLTSPGFKDVKPSVTRVIVIDHLMLNPAHDIYILVHAQIRYQVEKLKQGKITVVPMPSTQYKLQIKDSSIASLEDATSTVTGVSLGTTEVVLRDKNIKEVASMPSSTIHVIEPKYLGFVVLPGKNWVLETGRFYEILIEIYDRDSHKMFPADIPNIRIEADFVSEYFDVLHSTVNGTYHYVRTRQSGLTEIEAALVAIVKPDGELEKFKVPIRDTQEAEIFDPIRVQPEILVFPWQPRKPIPYQYTLKATGGTGTYVWTPGNRNIATVNVHGIVSTATEMGATNVTAADNRNPAHYGLSKVYVLPPSEIAFLDTTVEALVGSTLDLPLAGYALVPPGKLKAALTDCSTLPISIALSDTTIFQQTEGTANLVNGACRMIPVKALNPGHTQVTVAYEQGGQRLQAAITVSAYVPLKSNISQCTEIQDQYCPLYIGYEVLDPESIAVVSPAASKTFVLTGGPQPWVLDPSRYYERLTAEHPAWVSSKHVKMFGSNKNNHVFTVVCLQLGEQTFTVTVGNSPTAKNRQPAVSRATIQFLCASPIRLQLIPVINQPHLEEPCPITLDSNNQLPVLNSADLDIMVRAVDSHGNLFHNFSSLVVTWVSSDTSLATFPTPLTMYADVDGEIRGSKLLKAWEVCEMSEKLGSVTVTAASSGYDPALFKKYKIQLPLELKPLSASLDLNLVEEAAIDPEQIAIFNHPSNQVRFTLHGGSGHFLIRPSQQGIAEIDYDDKKKKIEVSPNHDGTLTLTAFDLCLKTSRHASAKIHIAGVNTIELKVVDKVQVDHDIAAAVQVLDSTGQPLSVSYFRMMNLEPRTGSDIITISPDVSKVQDQFTAYYTVHGATLGFTNLAFIASSKTGVPVSSKVRDIQVFPRLQLSPRNITLIVGAEFQVRSTGGPQPQSQIEYSMGDLQIASIATSGLLKALALGHSRVTGRAIGYDPETGSTVVYSQDVIDVYVIRLTGIKIHAPLLRLETDTEMPVYAMGTSEHETPFTFGNVMPGLDFFWTVTNRDVVRLEPVFEKQGVSSNTEHNVAMRIHTLNPGETSLKLQAIFNPSMASQSRYTSMLIDEIQLQVFERLELMAGCHNQLLVTPDTQAQLRTNRDGSARMSYVVLSSECTDYRREPLISVSRQGLVTAGAHTGQTTVLVTAYENFGVNQTLVVLVKVKPVSYIAIHSSSNLPTSPGEKLAVFPVGITLSLAVAFYDNVGDQFQATNTVLEHRLSRFDLLRLQAGPDNGTFIAQAAHIGSTIFKVWDKNSPWIEDYVNIPVGSVVQPSQTFVVGDVICFRSPLLTVEGQRGSWRSSTSSVLQLDGSSGVAVANRPGQTRLHHDIATSLATHAEVAVVPINKITLEREAVPFFTTVPREGGYEIPVTLNSEPSLKGDNCSSLLSSLRQELPSPPFQCQLAFKDRSVRVQAGELFHTFPGFNVQTGQYFCGVSQVQSKHAPSYLATLKADLTLVAVARPVPGQLEVRSEVATFAFHPPAHIHPAHLSLGLAQKDATIIVEGVEATLKALRVTVADSQLIQVTKPYSVNAHTLHYPVQLVDAAQRQFDSVVKTTEVELYDSLTGQKSVIPVGVNLVPLVERPAPEPQLTGWARVLQVIFSSYPYWILLLIVILAIAGMVLICYHLLLAPRYYSVPPNTGVFLRTPPSGSPPPYLAHSPAYQQSPYQSAFDTSLRHHPQQQQRSPTKLWSTAYSPQEGSSPQY
ncbi:nuclear pore membrane glycoprotein 210-like isoform X2 [Acanthaster planci]|uniref:Nuclear pore membrane glycoprotein 210-like isoform X2 n=1 Tax=Acanthaster planci TaxID=133434 RepID=A0A8B7Z3B7_ACAPL|nr:nuclear pore membrane glycoprotein 210-like isoform X2 [Acanthaster planci]